MVLKKYELRLIKRKLIVSIVAGLFFILMPLLLIAIDPMFMIGKYNFRLENGTILAEVLSEELECGRFQVYLFNITNAARFVAGEDRRLQLQEIGPFTYLEYRLNEDLELKDGVMRYTPRLRSVFVPEDSIGYPEDINITMPNIPMLSAFTLLSSYPSYIRSLLSIIAAQLRSKAIVSRTAHEYIWGYPDPILSLANNLAPGLIHFKTTGIMDRLYDKSTEYRLELGATDSDKFSVKNVKQSRKIQNGDQETVFESIANFTDTYEGIAYPPQLGPEDPINIYRVGICKSFGMTVCGTTTSEYGPQALVYRLKDELFREQTLCNSKGFCPKGLMDMGPCFLGLPLGMSKGHFLDGDPELLDRIEGLKPDRNIHESHLTIEPKIGLTLETHLSLQVNIVLGDLRYDAEAKSFSDMVLPIAHFQIKQPRLPEIAVRALTLMYITMPKVFLAVEILLLSTGSLFLFYSMKLLYILHINKTSKSVPLEITSNNNCLKVETPLIGKG